MVVKKIFRRRKNATVVTRYKLRTLFSSLDATKMYVDGLGEGVRVKAVFHGRRFGYVGWL
jgi:hypothetical protein